MGLLNFTYDDAKKFAPRRSDRVLPEQALNVRGLLDAATMVPVAGDALSGLLAVNDAAKGDYGSAAMNALGLLPFVSAAPLAAMKAIDKAAQMKGVTTKAGRLAKAMPGQAGAIVYHGSPHKFDKFDMSKIGTGEGAQAYGHGLYFAEAPETAMQYFGRLGYGKVEPKEAISKVLNGRADNPVERSVLGNAALYGDGFKNSFKNKSEVLKEIREKTNKFTGEKINAFSDVSDDELLKVIDELRGSASNALYKVDIPDEAVARFLDWDKPLSQQAPEVQAAMQNIKGKFPISKEGWDIKPFIDADPLFSTVHNAAVRELDIPANFFQKEFAAQGIPGIRYLDGVSRGQQSGTSNFVLFDDQMPRILEVNGNPTGLQPWAKGEWNGLLGF